MAKEDKERVNKPPATSSSSLVFSSVLNPSEPQSNQSNAKASDSNNAGPLEGQALGLLSQLMQSGQPSSLPNPVASGAPALPAPALPALPPMQSNSFSGIDNSSANQLFLDLVHSSNPGQLSNSANGSATMGDVDKRDDSSKQPAKGPKSIIKSGRKSDPRTAGRKSDPRMDAAVEAKINDPDLSLVDALRQGGFVFPDIDDTNAPQYTVVDSDNVKITQRKNQLLRRLRSMKKKS
jgi:hypothetical protein